MVKYHNIVVRIFCCYNSIRNHPPLLRTLNIKCSLACVYSKPVYYICVCVHVHYRTLNNVQSCLHTLRDDMKKLHLQMNQHSTAVKESQKLSRCVSLARAISLCVAKLFTSFHPEGANEIVVAR